MIKVRELIKVLGYCNPNATVWLEVGGDGAVHEDTLKKITLDEGTHVPHVTLSGEEV